MEEKKSALRIIALADEIIKFAREISTKDNIAQNKLKLRESQIFTSTLSEEFLDAELLKKTDSIIKIRKDRDILFEEDEIFSDPSWDILLTLFSAHLKGKNISVTSAGLAANIPATTARRWMNLLEDSGLVERKSDPANLKRSFVQVTDDAILKLTKLLGTYP